MKVSRFFSSAVLLGTALTLGPVGATQAQAPDSSADAAPSPASMARDMKFEALLATQYATLAGSEENARALVRGLRSGTEIQLLSPAGEATTFTPAASGMSYGNIKNALDLVQEQLAREGLPAATPAQLQAVLNGGSLIVGDGPQARTKPVPGILALRAQGRAWDQIAQQLDVEFGRAKSSASGAAAKASAKSKSPDLQPTGRDRAERDDPATSATSAASTRTSPKVPSSSDSDKPSAVPPAGEGPLDSASSDAADASRDTP